VTLSLTFEQALTALESAAAKQPERNLEDMGGTCLYFFDTYTAGATNDTNARKGIAARYAPGEPCCIVGQVLADNGLTIDDVGTYNEGCTVGGLAGGDLLSLDDRAHDLLRRAQEYQDCGKPWAEAVRLAKERDAAEQGAQPWETVSLD